MDDKLTELKEKQAEIGDKISLLRETNKRKDEEAAEIRQLIQECRENLNRIKSISPQTNECTCNESKEKIEEEQQPPQEEEKEEEKPEEEEEEQEEEQQLATPPCSPPKKSFEEPLPCRCEELLAKPRSEEPAPKSRCEELLAKSRYEEPAPKPREEPAPKPRCEELLPKPKDPCKKKENKKKNKERVSCKVDLNRMKVRVRGPSEDLKKLSATQLINLLEKFECQELIINTGNEIIKDPGEIRLIYFLHPGNIVMIAGIIMIAFLINTNICNCCKSKTSHLIVNGLYVSSLAFHYGMVLWMIFVRGFALRRGLNHDSFHLVDNIILPKYFTVCVLLSVLTLYSFLATQCVCMGTSWPLSVIAQISIIVVTFFMELTTICYTVPAVIKLRDTTDDYVVDDEDPNCSVPQSYEKNCIKLRKLSWTLCLINFLTFLLLGANIYYITCQMSGPTCL